MVNKYWCLKITPGFLCCFGRIPINTCKVELSLMFWRGKYALSTRHRSRDSNSACKRWGASDIYFSTMFRTKKVLSFRIQLSGTFSLASPATLNLERCEESITFKTHFRRSGTACWLLSETLLSPCLCPYAIRSYLMAFIRLLPSHSSLPCPLRCHYQYW